MVAAYSIQYHQLTGQGTALKYNQIIAIKAAPVFVTVVPDAREVIKSCTTE